MKKKFSLLKAATLCMVLGFLLICAAYVNGPIGLMTSFSDKFENEYGSAQKIVIDVNKNVGINIGKSESDKIIISGCNDKRQYFTVSESGGIISIGFTDARKWHERILNYTPDGYSRFGSLSIKIPENSNLDIEATLTGVSWGLHVYEVSIGGAFTVNAQNSTVRLNKFSAAKIDINANTSGKNPTKRIDITDVNILGDVSILASKTEIRIDGLECSNLTLFNKNDEILVSSAAAENTGVISAENTYIQLIGCSFGKSVKIKTAKQRIVVAALSAPDIEIENDNADILGTVSGIADEYNIICYCIGSCTLPFPRGNENTTKRLNVTNTYADIKLVFEN